MALMRAKGGYSRLELLVAITLIGVFAAVLLNRLSFYQEAAEKAKVEYTISLLKSALRIRMATMMQEGRGGSYASLEQQNPLNWLEDKSLVHVSTIANYASAEKFSGVWHFDPSDRTLTYWPIRKDYLQPDQSGQKRISLKVLLLREDVDAMQGAGSDGSVMSVRLQVEPYQWFEK